MRRGGRGPRMLARYSCAACRASTRCTPIRPARRERGATDVRGWNVERIRHRRRRRAKASMDSLSLSEKKSVFARNLIAQGPPKIDLLPASDPEEEAGQPPDEPRERTPPPTQDRRQDRRTPTDRPTARQPTQGRHTPRTPAHRPPKAGTRPTHHPHARRTPRPHERHHARGPPTTGTNGPRNAEGNAAPDQQHRRIRQKRRQNNAPHTKAEDQRRTDEAAAPDIAQRTR